MILFHYIKTVLAAWREKKRDPAYFEEVSYPLRELMEKVIGQRTVGHL